MTDARTEIWEGKARREAADYFALPETAWQKRNYHLRQLILAADALHLNALDMLESLRPTSPRSIGEIIQHSPIAAPIEKPHIVLHPATAGAAPAQGAPDGAGLACPHCARRFASQLGLNGHMKTHSKIYQTA